MTHDRPSAYRLFVALLTAVLISTACAAPRRTVKIALVAPFEGRLRQIGYEAFPALRIAIRDQIAAGGAGPVVVTFIAYNDDGDLAKATRVAHNVTLDPEVVAVIGHLVPSTTLAALAVYTRAGVPLLAPAIPADLVPADPLVFRMGPRLSGAPTAVARETCAALRRAPTPTFFGACRADAPPVAESPEAQRALAAFTEISLGAPPTQRSIVAYDATNVLLAAIRLDAQANGDPTRAGVAEALRRVRHAGLLGPISFDTAGAWADAPLWYYPD